MRRGRIRDVVNNASLPFGSVPSAAATISMPHRGLDDRLTFLSHSPARAIDWRLALVVGAVSALIFAILVPFAKVQLPVVWAFIPTYQAALITTDLITAVLLYAQFSLLRSRALLWLAGAYLFSTLMAVVHGLTFPGLFAPGGLLGATPQSTAWLYMFWHAGFPLLVIGYALLKDRNGAVPGRTARVSLVTNVAAVAAAVACIALLATAGAAALPPIMAGNNYTPALIFVVSATWAFSFAALAVLWWRRPHSVLDVWLMLVVVAWLFDIALSAVFNAGRFDLGFYAGRAYGLTAATFVLIVLLTETGRLYARVARNFRERHERDAAEISSINARLSTVLGSSPLPIFSLDRQGRIASWNDAAERIFGHAASVAVGKPMSALQAESGAFDDVSRRAAAGETVRDLHTQWHHRDGRVLDVSFSAAPIHERDGEPGGVVYVAEDITERMKLEHRLVQSQKMDAIGQLTGGIAHDFNNILTVITGTIDMLHDGLADRPQLAAVAKMIDEAATRGAELTQQLLAFARKQPLQPRQTDLNALVTNATKLSAAGARRADRDRVRFRRRRVARADRPDPADERDPQSCDQCARRHAEGRPAHARDAERRARRSLREGERRGRAGIICDDRGERHRHRHSGRDPRSGVRPLLHHQGDRQGHRPRPQHGVRLHQAVGRAHQDLQRGRARHRGEDVPAARGGCCRAGRRRRVGASARRQRNRSGGRGRSAGAQQRRHAARKPRLQDHRGGERRGRAAR